jgi:two-component system response regulator HupR/HoxA
VRLISATNRNLEQDVRQGRFREDLFYRLSAFTLHVPPLRQRPMDIPLIAEDLLRRTAASLRRDVKGFSSEAMDCMRRYRWPGNVRELQNEVLRMLALGDGMRLGAELLNPRVVGGMGQAEEPDLELLNGLAGHLQNRLDAIEARLLSEAMIRHRGNKTRAAVELGLSRVGLRAKLARHGVEGKEATDDGTA